MWTIDSTRSTATLLTPQFAASVDLRNPIRGVRLTQILGQTWGAATSLLGIDLGPIGPTAQPVAPDDCFVRGADLIATYPTTLRHTKTQIYWRALTASPDSPEFGVEVIASVQTDLLASDPRFQTRSQFPAQRWGMVPPDDNRVQWLTSLPTGTETEISPAPRAFCAEWPDAGVLYVELPYPGDSVATRWESSSSATSSVRLEQELLDPFLEKGVIRRCRIRGLLLPLATGADLLAGALERFERSQLPLTA